MGFTSEEIEANQKVLKSGVGGWTEEGKRWHLYLLNFANRWGQQPISSQAPLNYVDSLLKQMVLVLQRSPNGKGRQLERDYYHWWDTEAAPLLKKVQANQSFVEILTSPTADPSTAESVTEGTGN